MLENPGQMESPRRITEEADLPSLLFGDQIRLKQVLINLVNNALKFTKNGQICVKAAYDTLAELLIVHVTDTGKGISENSKTNLFKAFGKIKNISDTNEEGLGMGLFICKKIVENCGGSIDVHSNG